MAEDAAESTEKSKYVYSPRTPLWVKEGRKPVPPERETLVQGIANLQGIRPWKVEKIVQRRLRENKVQAKPQVPQKSFGGYEGPGMKKILRDTAEFEKKYAPPFKPEARLKAQAQAAPAELPRKGFFETVRSFIRGK